MAWTVLFGIALLAVGASAGFVLALMMGAFAGSFRSRSGRRRSASAVDRYEEGSPPTLAPHQAPDAWDPASESSSEMPEYDPTGEEDEVPTALYVQDDDLESALAELDTNDPRY